ncbi:MAG TPA: flagellar hook capping FlgD N-terminal domain-containing protein [Candidatus Krumholzibacteria bacterium]|nr:flagellar hook capping FlgD N-terminal domain-containing protein [Candidatus Krumholzibacteria bacterium]HPD71623.1 flagellar hook capping FlgD N-terminal domain-containing protein [Candidatus Krumholzibacteria bacterium]HRY41444.1 flagellar hook capping FlgD N-terminal domain-containing protein [Candidatus Krumholzibacteria bacterium]
MTVSAVTNSTTPVIGATATDPNELTSLDFMNLLVTELQNQDPLEPINTTQMANQLSQMTMAEQLSEIRTTMEENLLMSQSINNTAMLALVGRDVTIAGSEVHVAAGDATGSMLNCAGAGVATVTVRDGDGAIVATYVRNVDAGLNDLQWDGLRADGEAAADGEYTLEVSVKNGDNQSIQSTVLMTGAVSGLRYENGIAIVRVFGEEFYVSEIYQVS